MVDIGNRFINVQGIQRYWFPLFSIVCSKNSGRNMFAYGLKKKNIMWRLPYHHYLPQYIIMVDIQNIFINIQEIKMNQFPLCSIVC